MLDIDTSSSFALSNEARVLSLFYSVSNYQQPQLSNRSSPADCTNCKLRAVKSDFWGADLFFLAFYLK